MQEDRTKMLVHQKWNVLQQLCSANFFANSFSQSVCCFDDVRFCKCIFTDLVLVKQHHQHSRWVFLYIYVLFRFNYFFSRIFWKQKIFTFDRCMILSDWCSTFAIFKRWIKTSINSNASHCFEIHLNMKIEMVSCDSMKTPSPWWRVKFFFSCDFPFCTHMTSGKALLFN